jgi:hypothetical protein
MEGFSLMNRINTMLGFFFFSLFSCTAFAQPGTETNLVVRTATSTGANTSASTSTNVSSNAGTGIYTKYQEFTKATEQNSCVLPVAMPTSVFGKCFDDVFFSSDISANDLLVNNQNKRSEREYVKVKTVGDDPFGISGILNLKPEKIYEAAQEYAKEKAGRKSKDAPTDQQFAADEKLLNGVNFESYFFEGASSSGKEVRVLNAAARLACAVKLNSENFKLSFAPTPVTAKKPVLKTTQLSNEMQDVIEMKAQLECVRALRDHWATQIQDEGRASEVVVELRAASQTEKSLREKSEYRVLRAKAHPNPDCQSKIATIEGMKK